jgi:hypothetical protein
MSRGCGARCVNAATTCRCPCGGANHGSGRRQETTTSAAGAPVAAHADRPADLRDQPTPPGRSNPYWDAVRTVPAGPFVGPGSRWAPDPLRPGGGQGRDALVRRYAFAVPTPGDINWMARHLNGRPVIEVGAGNGYWAWQLSQAGVDVRAVDAGDAAPGDGNRFFDARRWHPIEHGTAETVELDGRRVLLLCWPHYQDEMAATALRRYRGDLLFYCGQLEGGASGSLAFHRQLRRDWEEVDASPFHVSWDGLFDVLVCYRRRQGAR